MSKKKISCDRAATCDARVPLRIRLPLLFKDVKTCLYKAYPEALNVVPFWL